MLRATTVAALLVAAAAPAFAQNARYQPLARGDERAYERSDAFGAARVIRTAVDGQTPSRVWSHFDSFLGLPDQWVAWHADAVWLWDAAVGVPVKMFDFAASAGQAYPVDFSRAFGAGAQVTLIARDETVVTNAGTFTDCVRFRFQTPPGVADAGWGTIWFAPDVGLVKWTESSFAGAVTFALDAATVGGVTYPRPAPSQGGVTVSLATDHYRYSFPRMAPVANVYATVTLTVENASGAPIDVTYSSGQTYDIHLVDQATGQTVWTWSANKAFIQILRQEQLSGTVTFTDSVPLPAKDADYVVRMQLTTLGRAFEASAPIQVRLTP